MTTLLLSLALAGAPLQHQLCRHPAGLLLSENVTEQLFRALAQALVYWNQTIGYAVFRPAQRGRIFVQVADEPRVRFVKRNGCVAAAVVSVPTEAPWLIRQQLGRVLGLPQNPTPQHYKTLRKLYRRKRGRDGSDRTTPPGSRQAR